VPFWVYASDVGTVLSHGDPWSALSCGHKKRIHFCVGCSGFQENSLLREQLRYFGQGQYGTGSERRDINGHRSQPTFRASWAAGNREPTGIPSTNPSQVPGQGEPLGVPPAMQEVPTGPSFPQPRTSKGDRSHAYGQTENAVQA
jgi:hypothetical protein